jgi:RNA polymerase sigma factor (sigma-70 family)
VAGAPENDALVVSALAGDQRAWDQIVQRYENLVWSVCRSIIFDRDLAVDVAQTVWLRLVEHLDRIEDPQALGAWLARTSRNECFKLRDRSKRWEVIVSNYVGDVVAEGADVDLLEREQLRLMRDALQRLSPECAVLMRLLTTDPPLSYREVAEAANIPIGTIGPRRKRCLAHARSILRE